MQLRFTLPLLLLNVLVACTGPVASPGPVAAAADSPATPASDDGARIIHLKDGGWMAGELRAGQRVGTWSSYFPDSTLRSRITYIEGSENGPTVVNHPNGMPYYVGTYTNGKSTGEWVFYDEQGTELKRVLFDSTGTAVTP
ncbi:MAG: hypothetical protein MUE88_06040 [Flavobacteriales bacterium]|jgi:hypothetical protein|nr:hypothetical protein [Flavobacteriales bacterium]